MTAYTTITTATGGTISIGASLDLSGFLSGATFSYDPLATIGTATDAITYAGSGDGITPSGTVAFDLLYSVGTTFSYLQVDNTGAPVYAWAQSTNDVIGSGTDAWSLTVSLWEDSVAPGDANASFYASSGFETISLGAQTALINKGAGSDGQTLTLSGTGGAALQAAFHALHLDNLSGNDVVNVLFQVTDTTTSSTAVFGEHITAPCYHTGTRIAVPAGEVAVETLKIGDLVMTATGVARPVKWIGRRAYTAAVAAANPHVRPVLIRQDAVAAGMPHRDLIVSPMHALFIDDVFVPAAALVNGVSIVRLDELAAVSYVHIEMDQHDVVFAEGLPAETFVDDNSRLMFDNADEFYALYGADRGCMAFSGARVEEGVQLEAIRRRIAARAGISQVAGAGVLRGNVERIVDGVLVGWVADTTTATPVELEVLADGEVIGRAVANRYRADLDVHGINGGRAGFSMSLPASVTELSQVSIRRATDGARIGAPVAVTVD